MENLPWRVKGGMEKVCIWLVIFNGRWFKYLNHLCCIVIILNVESKMGHVK
jgi:hypothetical protein